VGDQLVLLADFLPAIALGPVLGALADRYSRRLLAVSADLLRAACFVGLLVAVPGAVALRDTRVAAATAAYERRGRQTGRRARGAGRPAGY
jgi:MFS family permease